MDLKSQSMDVIETAISPHEHGSPPVPTEEQARARRRLKITGKDLKLHGFTDSCPRCALHKQGHHSRAQYIKHNEECRLRMYEAMRLVGSEKITKADAEGEFRTRPLADREKSKSSLKKRPAVDELVDEVPVDPPEQPDVALEQADDLDIPALVDDDDMGDDAAEQDTPMEEILHSDEMSAMVDVLQCLGIEAETAVAFRVSVMEAPADISFVEMYGQGSLITAAHNRRRDLNLVGLQAFDLRTCKSDGSHWAVELDANRCEACEYVREHKPTWVIG